MGQCRQKCWIAGGLVGLAVMLALLAAEGIPLAAALLLGIVAGGLMAGLLIWGLCEGRGTAAENDALMDVTWTPEPFEPSRRVVAAGGTLIYQRPLQNDAPDGLADTAPLDSVTLQASRDPDQAQPVPVSSPLPSDAPPPRVETVTTPDAPDEQADRDGKRKGKGSNKAGKAERKLAEAEAEAARKAAKALRKQERKAVKHGAAAADLAVGPDRVATVTDAVDPPAAHAPAGQRSAGEPESDQHDDLTVIEGVGPMEAGWLMSSGVTRLTQIAAWDGADIARFAGMMGRQGHLIREQDWAGQAARLTGGTQAAAGAPSRDAAGSDASFSDASANTGEGAHL